MAFNTAYDYEIITNNNKAIAQADIEMNKILKQCHVSNIRELEDCIGYMVFNGYNELLNIEMDVFLGYNRYQHADSVEEKNFRNGNKVKKIHTTFGDFKISVPQDRKGVFEPKIVQKRVKNALCSENKVLAMYTSALSPVQMAELFQDMYQPKTEEDLEIVKEYSTKFAPISKKWNSRAFEKSYDVIYIKSLDFSKYIPVVEDKKSKKKIDEPVVKDTSNNVLFAIIGANSSGIKQVLGFELMTLVNGNSSIFGNIPEDAEENTNVFSIYGEDKMFFGKLFYRLKSKGVDDVKYLCLDEDLRKMEHVAFDITEAMQKFYPTARLYDKYN